MLKKIFSFCKQQKQKKSLTQFKNEVAKNLETFFVSKQLGQLSFFDLAAWERLRNHKIARQEEILDYVKRIKEFNAALRAAQEYEMWYAADLARQNQETAKILHDRKELAQEKFAGLESIIKATEVVIKNFHNL